MRLLTNENEELKKDVHLCKAEVNGMKKRNEIPDNLQKIALLALETANKEKEELKS